MTISETLQATSVEQPTLSIRTLNRKQSCNMMHRVAELISDNFFSEGSQASLVQDNLKTDCLFLLPSGHQVRIMVTINE